ncbi:MAG: homoserine dehydrogenase [Candidatus Methylarchaceae archaeon HK02M1]|nr:homoserine dehydrogenase [Candidatus Methylarchaceae archaeon HK02M1]
MRIILVGFGVVGQSFLHLLTLRYKELIQNYGLRPKIVAIADKGGAAINERGLDMEKILQIKKKGSVSFDSDYGFPKLQAEEVIKKVDTEIVIEVTPTNIKDGEPGLMHIEMAIKKGKHIITTNKGPLAVALPALTELADYNEVYLRFSGTVGGGIPILDLGRKCLIGNRVLSIKGILNGTTNYILTEMRDKGIEFDGALKIAQELGYAEKDPSLDVDGLDTACKLVIMANWIMGKKVTLKDVCIHGIRHITLKDLKDAEKKDCTIKLIGSIDEVLEVRPIEISKKDILCVPGTLNAVTFNTEFAGEETIIGRGAGGMETASAILRDLIDIKSNLSREYMT